MDWVLEKIVYPAMLMGLAVVSAAAIFTGLWLVWRLISVL